MGEGKGGEVAAISLGLIQGARRSVIWAFLINGIATGSWVARIPSIQEALGLGPDSLGVALLGAAIGALVAMQASGWLVTRVGSSAVTRGAAIVLCAALPLPALAVGTASLLLSLLLLGASNGMMDVAMNAQGVLVEREYRRPILSSFHGLWSIGGLIGAGVTSLAITLGVPTLHQLALLGIVLAAMVLLGTASLLPHAPGPTDRIPLRLPPLGLIVIGVVAFCAMLSEGAIGDWSGVLLRQTLDAPASIAALGYGAFSLTMAAGRLMGDRLILRLGPVAVVRASGLLAAFGVLLATAAPAAPLALIGFALAGAGLSTVVPIAISAAGRVPKVATGPAIATAASIGYTGFLVGPPVIGFTSAAFSLRIGLGLVVLICLIGAALAGVTARRSA